MKKNNLLYATIVLAIGLLGAASCKKKIHSNAPTPNNVRMVSYNKITTYQQSVPIPIPNAKVNESFRFYYDDLNRVSQIVHTGNDSNTFFKRIDFRYSNDTIFKTITNIIGNVVVERDTFIKNSDGLIVTAFTPHSAYGMNFGVKNTFQYYGKLLARNTRTTTNWNHITASTEVTYTSVNGDFLKQYPSGKLDVEFYALTQPLDIDWWQGFFNNTDFAHTDSAKITDLKSNNLTFNSYGYTKGMSIFVKDDVSDTSSLIIPAWDWYNQSYHFYEKNANRNGDWLQIESFTMYGQNIYLNNHLVESISSRMKNAYITYQYDAESKIIQTSAIVTDSMLNKATYTYDIQYETF